MRNEPNNECEPGVERELITQFNERLKTMTKEPSIKPCQVINNTKAEFRPELLSMFRKKALWLSRLIGKLIIQIKSRYLVTIHYF